MDSLTAASQWIFPMECPDCKGPSAYPYEAATIRGTSAKIRLGLRCRQCRHEWKVDLDTDKLPCPDRAT